MLPLEIRALLTPLLKAAVESQSNIMLVKLRPMRHSYVISSTIRLYFNKYLHFHSTTKIFDLNVQIKPQHWLLDRFDSSNCRSPSPVRIITSELFSCGSIKNCFRSDVNIRSGWGTRWYVPDCLNPDLSCPEFSHRSEKAELMFDLSLFMWNSLLSSSDCW